MTPLERATAAQEAELARSTESLISSTGKMIALKRAQQATDGAGGKIPASFTTQAPVKRLFSATRSEDRDRTVEVGEVTLQQFVLIGVYGDDIKESDTFQVGAHSYRVDQVDDNFTWQVKALCSRVK